MKGSAESSSPASLTANVPSGHHEVHNMMTSEMYDHWSPMNIICFI